MLFFKEHTFFTISVRITKSRHDCKNPKRLEKLYRRLNPQDQLRFSRQRFSIFMQQERLKLLMKCKEAWTVYSQTPLSGEFSRHDEVKQWQNFLQGMRRGGFRSQNTKNCQWKSQNPIPINNPSCSIILWIIFQTS